MSPPPVDRQAELQKVCQLAWAGNQRDDAQAIVG